MARNVPTPTENDHMLSVKYSEFLFGKLGFEGLMQELARWNYVYDANIINIDDLLTASPKTVNEYD